MEKQITRKFKIDLMNYIVYHGDACNYEAAGRWAVLRAVGWVDRYIIDKLNQVYYHIPGDPRLIITLYTMKDIDMGEYGYVLVNDFVTGLIIDLEEVG